MIRSMTGYGRGEAKEDGRVFTVEMRAVNHRYGDISIKIAKQMSFLEDKVRELVSRFLFRGKIDVFITYENFNNDSKLAIVDKELAKAYVDALYLLKNDYGLIDDVSVSLVAKFPDVVKIESASEDEEKLWGILKKAIEMGIDSLIKMRKDEGQKLKNDLLKRSEIINKSLLVIKQRSPYVVSEYREKLKTRISELLDKSVVDDSRIAMETALFADRCSINEEIVRLDSHINQLSTTFAIDQPIGRKLDFLIQEMLREINTIGSKANDLGIINEVLTIKSEIEKMREQVQNIE